MSCVEVARVFGQHSYRLSQWYQIGEKIYSKMDWFKATNIEICTWSKLWNWSEASADFGTAFTRTE